MGFISIYSCPFVQKNHDIDIHYKYITCIEGIYCNSVIDGRRTQLCDDNNDVPTVSGCIRKL